TPRELCAMIDAGSYDICQPDATVAGGIGAVLSVGEHARRQNVQTVVHAWGGAACLMANYHCAFALGSELAEYPIPPYALREALMVEPLAIAAGHIHPPTKPGLGIQLDAAVEWEFAFRSDAVYAGLS